MTICSTPNASHARCSRTTTTKQQQQQSMASHIYFPNHAPGAPNSPTAQHRMTHAARRALQDEQRARKAAAMMANPCEIVLVRHGETAWNKEGRLQGQAEPGPPLDDLGFQQAAVAAEVLRERFPKVDAVFSSDLLRAVQTAELVAAAYQLQVQQHKGLRERNMGMLQGLTYTDAPHAEPEAWAALQSDSTATQVPGGESLDELRERLTAAVLDVARSHPGQRVVLISHGGALHSLHRAARGYQAKGKVFNCSISVLLAEADAAAQHGQHTGQHTHVAAGQQQQQQQRVGTLAHLDPSDPAAVSLRVVESDADQLAVVWCDAAELCDHCSSSDGPHADSTSAAAGGADGAGVCSSSGTHLDSSEGAAAAAQGKSHRGRTKQCGGGRVRGGRLAMLSWNDSYALQAAHLQSDKAFGGSSRAG